jgi:predicted RNase H-like HicB family nuclease
MRYAIVIEGDATTNYSAYVPDVPGCIAAGKTIEEVKLLLAEALAIHLEDVPEAERPKPTSIVDYVEAA